MALLKVFSLPVVTLSSGVAAPMYATSLASASITIQADPANTGVVAVGGIGVTTATGLTLSAGDTATLEMPTVRGHAEDIDLSTIYAVSATTGSKVRIAIMRRD